LHEKHASSARKHGVLPGLYDEPVFRTDQMYARLYSVKATGNEKRGSKLGEQSNKYMVREFMLQV